MNKTFNYYKTLINLSDTMAIANNNEQRPLIIFSFKKLCNGEQWLAAQQIVYSWSVTVSVMNAVC